MAYTTLAQLKNRIGSVVLAQLSVDNNATDVSTTALADAVLIIDTVAIANIDKAIADADALINQYVQAVVDIEDSVIQATFEPVSAELAVYCLYARRHNTGEDNPKFYAYKEKVNWLRMVAKREIKLATSPEAPIPVAYSSTSTRTPVVTDTSTDMY